MNRTLTDIRTILTAEGFEQTHDNTYRGMGCIITITDNLARVTSVTSGNVAGFRANTPLARLYLYDAIDAVASREG